MSRLNEKDLNILGTGLNIDFNSIEYSYLDGEFGENPNDYVEVLIYDEEENFLESGIVDESDYITLGNGRGVKLKTGTILRKFGYERGRYVVKYNFFRKLAGSYENLLVDVNQVTYPGEFTVNDQTGKITGTDNQELFIKENKYLIHEISPSRTELRIITQNIQNQKYISDFFNLQRNKKIIDSKRLGLDPASFVGVDTETKLTSNRIELPISTTTNMVGGYIYLNDLYIMNLIEEDLAEEGSETLYDDEDYWDYGGSPNV